MAIKYKIGDVTTTIADIQTTSDREINYAKTSSGKYLWTRPTTLDLQFSWDAFSSWTLLRTSSLNPDVAQSVTLATNSSTPTSGTNTYSFNTYYGDSLQFVYTAKPGAVIDQPNNYSFTIDPTFEVSNIIANKSELPDPSVEITSQWDFGEGTWNTVKNTETRSNFNLKVTKPEAVKSLPVDIYVQCKAAESFYRHNLNAITYEDTSVDVYSGSSTKVSTSDFTKIGTIAAGTLEQNFTLKVVDSSVNYCWPKGVKLVVKMVITSTAHYFSSTQRSKEAKAGTITATSGSGGYVPGGGYTGSGGTGHNSRW